METVISRWFAGCSEPPSVKLALSLGWIYCSNTTPTARGTELRALLRLRPARGHPPGDRGLQRAIAIMGEREKKCHQCEMGARSCDAIILQEHSG